ncbi:hypothetical protein PR202_ga19347 [Eleusine coracana subsp. coracana]|uniref:Uncharacterized protein n=1 Tax=Eleusine coracana subsp. coracana TaxID=191504 RepID=A0AAV5CUF7_ELECO|nr:hypothetical protein PR202_ga19347 [Eleusine coracana subsp. coracana]
MEAVASGLSSLLATLRVDGPWTPAGSWEDIAPESGSVRVSDPGGRPRQEPIYELASVTFYLFQSREINRTSRKLHKDDDADDRDDEQHGPYTLRQLS